MKIYNLRTYSRFYPTIIFRGKVHNWDNDRIGSIQSAIDNIFPNAMVAVRKKNRKLMGRSMPLYDIYIIPKELYYRFGNNLEFASFRLSLNGDSMAVSYWSSRIYRNSEIEGLVMPPFLYANLWENTREHIYKISKSNRSFAANWLNYLESLAILASYYHAFKELVRSIGFVSFPELDFSILQYIFPAEIRERQQFEQIKSALAGFIHEPYVHAMPDYIPNSNLYKAITRFPSIKFDWRKSFVDIVSNSINIDEVIGLLFAQMKISVGALAEGDDISDGKFGESYASLYFTINNSKLRDKNLHVSLISSIWDAIDNGSVVCTYENYNLNEANSQRLYFRTGNEMHPYIKLIAFAILTIENWRELTSNSPIAYNKLDQALSMFVIPESPYYQPQFDGLDTDFINIPESNGSTLLNTGKGGYYLLLNFLIRAGIFANREDGSRSNAVPSDKPLVYMVRETNLYRKCKADTLPVMKLFTLVDRPLFNPLLNNIFARSISVYNRHLDRCAKMALEYIRSCDIEYYDHNRCMTISIMMHKLQAMTVFLEKDDILNILGYKHHDIISLVSQLSDFDNERKLYEIAFKVLAITNHWFLYEAVFLKKDPTYASRCFYALTHIGNVQLDDSLKNLFDHTGHLKASISRMERDEAISCIISIMEKGVNHD